MQTLQRTPLHSRHVELGARLVPFAGWEMPVQYEGGIVDDLIVYKLEPYRLLLIVNASNRRADYEWLKERELRGSDVRDISDGYALLAVQGPRSIERLDLPDAKPFTFAEGELDGVECMVNRTGYTGERGVELLVEADDAIRLWDAVLERGAKPCGLGARDTLRLEVCYPLHGNDITPDTDAISAGLGMGYVDAAVAVPDGELTIDVRGRARKARIVKKPIYKRDD